MNQPSQELERASPEVKRYQRLRRWAGLLSMILGFAWLVVLGLWLGPHLGVWLNTWLDNRWLSLFAVAALLGTGAEVLSLPLDFWSGYILEHRFQLSNQTLAKWLWKRIKAYLLGIALGVPMVAGFYALLWWSGPYWWLWTALAYLFVSLILGRLAPVLLLPIFYKVSRLNEPALQARLERLAAGTGLTVEGVYWLHLSDETNKVNAALAGLGRTRRVLLGDTLLEQFTPEEIEIVFAHEIGHHVYKHIPKIIAVSVLLALAGFWLVDQSLSQLAPQLGYRDFRDPEALPLISLVLGAFGLMLLPAQNALSRFFERQCDRYALARTQHPDAYRSAFAKIARINKDDPDPHPLLVWLFHDHPPIRERLALAQETAA